MSLDNAMVNSDAHKAAEYTMQIWKSHDEENYRKLSESSASLFELTSRADLFECKVAGVYEAAAFRFADLAEEYQGKDEELEDRGYYQAEQVLKKAYLIVGFPPVAAKPEVEWWKAFRHKDVSLTKEKIIEARQHFLDTNKHEILDEVVDYILVAGKQQRANKWDKVTMMLEKYYAQMLPEVKPNFFK